jgi:hypothetical protein
MLNKPKTKEGVVSHGSLQLPPFTPLQEVGTDDYN